MSFIHLYLDKENDSNDEFINLLKEHNVDFLQYNLKNNENYIEAYKLESIPAIKFKNSIIHEINEDSVKTIVDEFNNFIDSLPSITKPKDTSEIKLETNAENKEEKQEEEEPNTTSSNQILMKTIKISNKEKLSSYIKAFSEKYKK